MSRKFLSMFAVLVAASFGCSESGDAESATLTLGEFCAASVPEHCPGGMCREAVGGESCDNISCADWSRPANQGTICTKSCSGDADCAGIDFATTNEEQVSSESWFCAEGVCNVLVTATPGEATNICTGCGGVFWAGRCIGCPQC